MKKNRVLLVEPICVDQEHVGFNRAFIKTIKNNIDEYDVVCQENHFKLLNLKGIFYKNNSIYNSLSKKLVLRLFQELIFSTYIFFISFIYYKKTVFLSYTKINILVFGFLSCFFSGNNFFISHSILSTIENDKKFLSLKRLLLLLIRNNKILVLGEPIKKNIEPTLGSANIISIPHIYDMDLKSVYSDRSIKNNSVVNFSFLGVVSKAKKNLIYLSRNSNNLNEDNFKIIGYSTSATKEIKFKISKKPLSDKTYTDLIKKTDFIVSCIDPYRYRLTASGTFFDSLKFTVPGIYLKNDFVKFYFNKYGKLGYLCENMKDMVALIDKICVNGIDIEYYNLCQNNIIKARNDFTPENNKQLFMDIGL